MAGADAVGDSAGGAVGAGGSVDEADTVGDSAGGAVGVAGTTVGSSVAASVALGTAVGVYCRGVGRGVRVLGFVGTPVAVAGYWVSVGPGTGVCDGSVAFGAVGVALLGVSSAGGWLGTADGSGVGEPSWIMTGVLRGGAVVGAEVDVGSDTGRMVARGGIEVAS